MVSGLIRDSKRNVAERSNIAWLIWPDNATAISSDVIPVRAQTFQRFLDPVTEQPLPEPVLP
jgi:hypothetical protein